MRRVCFLEVSLQLSSVLLYLHILRLLLHRFYFDSCYIVFKFDPFYGAPPHCNILRLIFSLFAYRFFNTPDPDGFFMYGGRNFGFFSSTGRYHVPVLQENGINQQAGKFFNMTWFPLKLFSFIYSMDIHLCINTF